MVIVHSPNEFVKHYFLEAFRLGVPNLPAR